MRKFSNRLTWYVIVTMLAGLTGGLVATEPTPEAEEGTLAISAMPEKNRMGVHFDQALESLNAVEPESAEPLEANFEVSRGPAGDIYSQVAPSVVVIQTGAGHGTGFIIDQSGWIVTNEHVVAKATIDIKSGCQFVFVYLGKLEDGLMTVQPQALTAYVYATDKVKDLALLKLAELPKDQDLRPVRLAERSLSPGKDCVAIGHPTRGTLWTVRSGEVTGVGFWPHDLVDNLTSSLRLTGTDKEDFTRQLEAAGKRRVLLSTCGINPGDSGGPLFNEDGEVVAVTFGIPKGQSDSGISLDKFSYHVHLDELKEFLKARPESPPVYVPSAWPASQTSALFDHDGDGRFDRWQFAIPKQSNPPKDPPEHTTVGILIDLDQNTPEDFLDNFREQQNRDLFDYELVIHLEPILRAFYDTDNDGQIDLILVDLNQDKLSDLTIQLIDGVWAKVDLPNQKVLDAKLFKDPALRARFHKRVYGNNTIDANRAAAAASQ